MSRSIVNGIDIEKELRASTPYLKQMARMFAAGDEDFAVDLFQEGAIAIYMAAQKFDHKRLNKFSTYCRPAMRNRMIAAVRARTKLKKQENEVFSTLVHSGRVRANLVDDIELTDAGETCIGTIKHRNYHDPTFDAMLRVDLERELAKMTPEEKKVTILRGREMNGRQIARELGLTPEAFYRKVDAPWKQKITQIRRNLEL